MKRPRRFEKYSQLFEAHMQKFDPLQQVIINGHLIIESALDNILSLIFFHPGHLIRARFSFSQKMNLARAFAYKKDMLQPWTLIASINAARNELAHNLVGEKRTDKIDQLIRLFKDSARSRTVAATKGKPKHYIVYAAVAECVGFLGTLEEDLTGLRGHIDALHSVLGIDEAERDRGK